MKNEVWLKLYQEMKDSSDKVLAAKAENYAGEDDRLYNFGVGMDMMGEITDIPGKAVVCYAYMTKHLSRLVKMLSDHKVYTPEEAREVLGDIRNYMYLLEACMYDDGSIIATGELHE